MADTRRDKRAPVSLKVRFKSASIDEFIEQYSFDMSSGGLFIKSKSPLEVGTLLKFELQLKDESQFVQGVGRVVWTREAVDADDDRPPGMGIKFIKMSEGSQQTVQRIVGARQEGPSSFEQGTEGHAPSTRVSQSPAPSRDRPDEFDEPTHVRHASEFLALALAKAGASPHTSEEARRGAEEARRRIARSSEVPDFSGRQYQSESELSDEEPTRAMGTDFVSKRPSGQGATSEAPAARDPSIQPSGFQEPGFQEPGFQESGFQESGAEASGADTEQAADAPAAIESAPPAPSQRPPAPSQGAPAHAVVKPGSQAPRFILWLGLGLLMGIIVFFILGGPSLLRKSEAETKEIQSTPVAAAAVSAPQPPTQVELTVKSNPQGATIALDGKEVGVTPATLSIAEGTDQALTLSLEGYATRLEQVPEEQTTIEVDLERLNYELSVDSAPSGAVAKLGSQSVRTPGVLTLEDVEPGAVLRVTKRGYSTFTRRVHPDEFEASATARKLKVLAQLKRHAKARRPQPKSASPPASLAPASSTPTSSPPTSSPPTSAAGEGAAPERVAGEGTPVAVEKAPVESSDR